MDGQAAVLAAGVPVYALDFADPTHLFYVGGGGSGRTGVANGIVRATLTRNLPNCSSSTAQRCAPQANCS